MLQEYYVIVSVLGDTENCDVTSLVRPAWGDTGLAVAEAEADSDNYFHFGLNSNAMQYPLCDVILPLRTGFKFIAV